MNILDRVKLGPSLAAAAAGLGTLLLAPKAAAYVPRPGNKVDSTYFTMDELTATSKKGCGLNQPNGTQRKNLQALVDNVLDPLRAALNRPVRITSGFRSACVNRKVGGASGSQHAKGEAVDIKVDGMSALQLAQSLQQMQAQGTLRVDQVIWYSTSRGGHVHVSFKRDGYNRGQFLYAPSESEQSGRFSGRLTSSGKYVSITPTSYASSYGVA